MEKEDFLRVFLIVSALILTAQTTSAALGISPAKTEINFMQNEEYPIQYTVFSDDPYKKIDLYAEGDLAQYVSLNKKELLGGGTFTATINFPNEMPSPGLHRLLIGAKEQIGESKFIGTSLNIRAVIYVYVPYPGKYIESELTIPNANAGEIIPINLRISNRGKDNLLITPHIDFYDATKMLIATIPFNPSQIESGSNKEFIEGLNTTGYKSGNYIALAEIDFSGEKQNVNKTFKIGNLLVKLDNFTTSIEKEPISKFLIGVTSEWNDNIPEIYAEINISNNTFSTSFRTPSVDLVAWESKTIVGFFDASLLKKQIYKTEIILNYLDEQKVTFGNLAVTENGIIWTVSLYSSIAVLACSIIVLTILITRKFVKRR